MLPPPPPLGPLLAPSACLPACRLQEAKTLRAQQHSLQAALDQAREESTALAASLEGAQRDAAQSQALMALSASRNAVLDKAWAVAAEVGG